jgi:hypothetical protein
VQLKNIYGVMITQLRQQHIFDSENGDCGCAFLRLKRYGR